MIDLYRFASAHLAELGVAAVVCQLLAIVVLVEGLKGVDRNVAGATTAKHRAHLLAEERRARAGFGLVLDLSIYLLAIEILVTFAALTR